MDWVEAMEDYGQALERVAVMLFALARLTGRAALAPRPVRAFVLWVMRPAEITAWRFLATKAGMADQPAEPVLPWRRDSVADALHLARRLRALAGVARRLSVRQRRQVRCLLARERFAGVLSRAPAARLPTAMPEPVEALPKPLTMRGGAPVRIDTS